MRDFQQKIHQAWRRGQRFALHDVWDIEPRSLSFLKASGVRVLRILNLVFRGFREDQCSLHASALTYTSLMALVPILALTLWLARGMGGEELFKNQIRGAIDDWTEALARPAPALQIEQDAPPHPADTDAPPAGVALADPDVAEQIRDLVEQAFDKIGNVSFAALGGVGLALLIWMVLAVLGKVEFSFNRVWGISRERSLWRKFTDYLSVLFVLPVLVLAASSLPMADLVGRVLHESAAHAFRDSMGSGFLKAATVLLMTCLTFTFVIAFMPNTRVRIKPALIGGVVAGLLFIGWLRLCAALQVGVARYGAIYGSFAVVPILLAWVYVSWQIVLFGAELAFATQNYATYKMERGAGKANIQSRIVLALAIVAEAARAMRDNAPPFLVSEYAVEQRIPVRFLNNVVGELVQAGYLAEISESAGRYVLLKAPDTLKVREIVNTVMLAGIPPADMGIGDVNPAATRIVQQAKDGLDAALADRTLADLINQPETKGE